MAIQHGLGKLPLPSRQIVAEVGAQGFGWLSITPGHAQAVLDLAATISLATKCASACVGSWLRYTAHRP